MKKSKRICRYCNKTIKTSTAYHLGHKKKCRIAHADHLMTGLEQVINAHKELKQRMEAL